MTSTPALDLSHLPPAFLLPTHLEPSKAANVESQLRLYNCPIANSPISASLFLGDINTAKRCDFELRGRGIKTTPLSPTSPATGSGAPIRVVKLKWFTESLAAGKLLPIEGYTVYTATVLSQTLTPSPERPQTEKATADEKRRREILERARREGLRNKEEDRLYADDRLRHRKRNDYGDLSARQRMGTNEILALSMTSPSGKKDKRPSTPEKEVVFARGLKSMPKWVQEHNQFSCCRFTPSTSPNALFIFQLKAIRLARIIGNDPIGIRAYSTMIATIQAYPYLLTSPSEIALLPGCDGKASALFKEWLNSSSIPEERSIKVVTELERSESFKILKMFYNIWGVGPAVAGEFYYNNDWKSIDDIVEFGWDKLSRARQIGVKYYDEFLKPIPRLEAERIGEIVGKHASKLRPGMSYTLVGGYRRGQQEMGDVDIILSHTTDSQTQGGFIRDLIASLESEGWVTHTLKLGRAELASEDDKYQHNGQGFDNFEKALVVWQEQEYSDIQTRTRLASRSTGKKNTNPHRRVDLILAPPACVGTAVLGWTGGTTFQRDLRLWCDKVKGWKFTSEGVFDQGTQHRVGVDGTWMEGMRGMEEAERNVFKGLGLEWVPPEMRCTG